MLRCSSMLVGCVCGDDIAMAIPLAARRVAADWRRRAGAQRRMRQASAGTVCRTDRLGVCVADVMAWCVPRYKQSIPLPFSPSPSPLPTMPFTGSDICKVCSLTSRQWHP